MANKPALGKGLGALIKKQAGSQVVPEATISADERKLVRDVALTQIVPSPLQPRKHFVEAPLDELMESIRQHGIIQPLIVRRVGEKLELIAGERRWRASTKLIENLQRADLNPMEEAAGYVRLAKEYALKQDEIASRVGKSRASVANAMDVQMQVAQGRISVGHAKALLALKDQSLQLLASDQVMRKSLTVRATEKLVQQMANGVGGKTRATGAGTLASATELEPHLRDLENRLRTLFATQVSITHAPKKGKIEIEYYGNDDLQRILELLGVDE
ncbi:MAG: ParB/RepB/Spo0J family partition protein [Verrucomicrobia bacterium]|nr:MAG: ParB/RepB/Spo0J family partition protein [Verrucomicrobiota bacterium]